LHAASVLPMRSGNTPIKAFVLWGGAYQRPAIRGSGGLLSHPTSCLFSLLIPRPRTPVGSNCVEPDPWHKNPYGVLDDFERPWFRSPPLKARYHGFPLTSELYTLPPAIKSLHCFEVPPDALLHLRLLLSYWRALCQSISIAQVSFPIRGRGFEPVTFR